MKARFHDIRWSFFDLDVADRTRAQVDFGCSKSHLLP